MEVAGLALGAFSVLVSALDGSRKGYQFTQDWWRIKRKYDKCLKVIQAEQMLYRFDLEEVLKRLCYDDDEINLLLDNPVGPQWSSDDLGERLKRELPHSHSEYIDAMIDINEGLAALSKELGLDNPGFQKRIGASTSRPTTQTRKAFTEWLRGETRRVRFTLNASKRDELLADIRVRNQHLVRFSGESPAPVNMLERRKARKKAAMPQHLYHYWQHAKDLYHQLLAVSACRCQASHHAHLTLQQHHAGSEVEFSVLFTFAESITCQTAAGWRWKETRITLEDQHYSSRSSVPNIVHNIRPVPSIRIAGAAQSISYQGAMTGLPLGSMNTSASPPITNLCSTMADSSAPSPFLGNLRQGQKEYSVRLPDTGQLPATSLQPVALRDILAGRSTTRLNRQQRYKLALTTASAYLQLHASPWLGANWSQRAIYLLFDSAQSSFLEQPRIARDFVTPDSQGPADHSIGALGIVLLELVFGKPLEQYALYSRHLTSQGPTEWSDTSAALRWCVEEAFAEEKTFADVIEWCLKQSPMRGTMDEDRDRSWRLELFENVVEPLAVCCKETFG